MPLFEWNNNYSVNVDSIDSEHKMLLGWLNKLFDLLSEGKSKEGLNDTIRNLEDYAKNHFRREETIFQKIDYPFYQEHRALHVQFENEIEKFKNQIEQNDLSISVEVIEFLRDWFIDHIQGADKQYVPYFNEFGIE